MEDPTSVFVIALSFCIALVFVLITGVAIFLVLKNQAQQKQKVELLKNTGLQGEATVLDYQVTETGSENDDIAWLRLEMRVPSLKPYILEKRTPLAYARYLKKDMIVSVWVDKNNPQDPNKVGVEIKR